MEIKRENNSLYLGSSYEKRIGELTFKIKDDDMIVDHTFVDPAFRGQGLAFKLVEEVVELARSEMKTIIPVCPYVKKVMEETEAFQDVLKEE